MKSYTASECFLGCIRAFSITRSVILLALMGITAAFEFLVLTLFANLVSQDSLAEAFKAIIFNFEVTLNPVTIASLIALRASFGLVYSLFSARYQSEMKSSISNAVARIALKDTYSEDLLLRDLLVEPNFLVSKLIMPIYQIVFDCLLAIGILSALVLQIGFPAIAAVLIFALVAPLYLFFFKPVISSLARGRSVSEKLRYRCVQRFAEESGHHRLRRLIQMNDLYADISARLTWVISMPKIILESIILLGLVIFLIGFLTQQTTAVFSLVIFALLRLQPIIQGLVTNIQRLSLSGPSFNLAKIYSEDLR